MEEEEAKPNVESCDRASAPDRNGSRYWYQSRRPDLLIGTNTCACREVNNDINGFCLHDLFKQRTIANISSIKCAFGVIQQASIVLFDLRVIAKIKCIDDTDGVSSCEQGLCCMRADKPCSTRNEYMFAHFALRFRNLERKSCLIWHRPLLPQTERKNRKKPQKLQWQWEF